MKVGWIEKIGSPEHFLNRALLSFVADFFGSVDARAVQGVRPTAVSNRAPGLAAGFPCRGRAIFLNLPAGKAAAHLRIG